jgi:hypothetical protein
VILSGYSGHDRFAIWGSMCSWKPAIVGRVSGEVWHIRMIWRRETEKRIGVDLEFRAQHFRAWKANLKCIRFNDRYEALYF